MNGIGDVSATVRDALFQGGADLVGIGDLTGLPPGDRFHMPTGVAVAVKYEKDVIRGIREMPTKAYMTQYHQLNGRLNALVAMGADLLGALGYHAIAMTTDFVAQYETNLSSPLPHKTVARASGMGWIGKCALLVTPQYGSMVRISSILTDAKLKAGTPFPQTQCGGCTACVDACPAGAVVGGNWQPGGARDDIFRAALCRQTARSRAQEALGADITLCGRCIQACPYTRRYLDQG